MTIKDDLAKLTAAPPMPTKPSAPRGFEPGVEYVGGVPTTVTTGPIDHELTDPDEQMAAVLEMGVVLLDGTRLEVVESRYDPAAWFRDSDDRGTPHSAYTKPAWRYRFRVVRTGDVRDGDLAALFKEAKRSAKLNRRVSNTATGSPSHPETFVVVLGDFQVGKVDYRGGTPELLQRLEHVRATVLALARKRKPAEIVLVDAGDAMEMFESAPGADRTNDLGLTEQIRLWRRIFWSWVHDLSRLTLDLKVVSVPSNHCRVRRGKESMGPPSEDYGIEVLAQLSDIAAANPEAYGHVTFLAPAKHDEALALELHGGKVLGVAHGNQKVRPEQIESWMAGQALGRSPVGYADILVIGHWHHLRVQTFGDDRWVFIAPTMDGGSSWFRAGTGGESAPGVLTFSVGERGWLNFDVAWARPGVDIPEPSA